MRNSKRLTAFVLAFLMVLTSFGTAAFAETPNISDVSGHWAEDTIQSWVDDGLIKGYVDGTFKPDQSITRAEFITLVNRAFGYTKTATIRFTDVDQNAWYASAVAVAVEAGYITGYPDGTMRPDNPISREEAATIIRKITKLVANPTAADTFTDAASLIWSNGAVGAVFAADIMIGYPDGSFGPQKLIKRGEATVALDRAMKYMAVPVTPLAPSVTRDDDTNTVSGMTTAMEYKLDSADYVTYVASAFDDLDFSGNHTLMVRFATLGINPFGPATTLTFTTNESTSGRSHDIDVRAITVTGSALTITTDNGTLTMSAIVVPSNATNKNVTWSVENTTGSATISVDGLLTAVTNGEVIVKATSVSTETISGTLVVTLSEQVITDVTSAEYTLVAENNTVTVTLTDGTFKAGEIVADDFTFAGTNADALAVGAFVRTGDTVVTITVATDLVGTNNTVLVKAATQATQASSVAAVASTVEESTVVEPVDLGTAGEYAILAKTGISTVPTSAITGDIGVSPIAATAITGFSLKADATNEFSTSTQVTGDVYAPDYADPTPDNLTTAIGDMEAAYTDAAGKAVSYVNLYAGDLSGQILTPGVYKYSTDVLINTDVTLFGDADDVFIFQIAGKITQANAASINLTGGAQAKNIFWQAADTVSIGTTAHFEGIVLAMTNITLGTNASVYGRLLAQTAVTLDQSTVVESSVELGAAVTGLDVPANVLQLGQTTTATASTIEVDGGTWTSSNKAVATVDGSTGAVAALTAGTTTIAYTSSTSGNVNSQAITVYAAVAVANPIIGAVQVGGGDVTPTGFTAAGTGETIAWVSSDVAKATIVAGTGVITPVEAGDTTISYAVTETATGKIVAEGSLAVTVIN